MLTTGLQGGGKDSKTNSTTNSNVGPEMMERGRKVERGRGERKREISKGGGNRRRRDNEQNELHGVAAEDKVYLTESSKEEYEEENQEGSRGSSVDLAFEIAMKFHDDLIKIMKQHKTPEAITRAIAEAIPGCKTQQVHECGENMDMKHQHGGLCGGGQDNDGSIQPPQTRSYASVLAKGLQGGGKDGKTSRRNSNPVASTFLRLENPSGSNACFSIFFRSFCLPFYSTRFTAIT